MSASVTRTSTYTAVDIRKVVDNFAADFSMMGQATGLRTRDQIAPTVADLKTFAEKGYLIDVTLILKDKDGNQLRGAVYKVSESATGWSSERPGDNLWPRTPDGSLKVIANLKSSWWEKTEDQKATFIKDNLNSGWPLTDEDTTFSGLAASTGQRYASNGYGMERTNYS